LSDQPDSTITELPARRRKHGESFYVVGGPVQPRRGCYVERAADRQLLDKLRDGEYCNVLAPRQTGKSSLVARTAMRLREEGFGTAVVDLSQSIGREPEREAGRWYYGIAYRIVRDLRLAVDLQAWWQEKKPLTPLQRLNEFFWEIVLANSRAPIVIFIDSLEVAESLEFTDDLFLAVRSCHDARAAEPDYERLRFALLGTVLPEEPDGSGRPRLYDVGRPIELSDFTFQEARPLCRELGLESGDAERALYRVFYWTGGQPYLTQKLCRAIARSSSSVDGDEDVDRLVESRFLAGNAPFSEPNLRQMREQLGRRDKLAQTALRLYRRISRGRTIRYDRHSPLHEYLRIAGLVRVCDERRLRVRNLIYGRVFTARWVSQTVPFDWRGASSALAFLLLIVGVPYWYTQLLPKPYIETLRVATVDYDVAVDAHDGLSSIPGFRQTANELFAGVLERRSRQAVTWEQVLAADMSLRGMPGYAPTADALLSEFWDRRAAAAEAQERRDLALVYRLRALESPNRAREQRAASLIEPDYPALLTTIRPGAPIDALGMDPGGAQVVTLSNGHVISTWSAESGLRRGEGTGFEALAEEFVTVRRRAVVEAPGDVRSVELRVWLEHPQPTDVVFRLVSPGGRGVTLPVVRPNREADEPYRFTPETDAGLARFRREDARGTWTLEVEDRLSGTTGLLSRWSLKLSDREGHTLEDVPASPVLIPDPRPTSQVIVTLSPDARRAAAISADPATRGFLQVWDVNTAAVTARIPTEADARFVAFDPAGQFLVTAGQGADARIRVWRVAAGQPVLELEPERSFSADPALSVTGSFMAVVDGDAQSGARIRSWDIATAEERRPLPVGGDAIDLALGPDGRWLALLDRRNVVRVFDLPGRRGIGLLPHDSPVVRMHFDPSGRWLATIDAAARARIWDLRNEQVAPEPLLVRESHDPASLAFGAGGDSLVLHGRARSFEWLALPSGRIVAGPLRHAGDWDLVVPATGPTRLQASTFRADGLRVVTGRGGRTAITWQIEALPSPVAPPASDVGAASGAGEAAAGPALRTLVTAVNPLADQVALGGLDGRVEFRDRGQPWSATAGAEPPAGHADRVAALAYSADGSHLASVGADGSVLSWSAAGREVVGEAFYHGSGPVSAVALSNDGSRMLIGGELGAQVWRARTGEPLSVLGPGRRILAAALSDDGRLAVTASEPGEIRLWNTDTGTELWSTTAPGPVRVLALRPDQDQLAAATDRGEVLLWSLGERSPPTRFDTRGHVVTLRYAPAGERLVVQTSEWVHLVDLTGTPTIAGSLLMSGLTQPGGLRFESDEGARISVLVDRGPGDVELQHLDFFDPRPVSAQLRDFGPIEDWLRRLKLRFDTAGELVPSSDDRLP
jgi:WD40 repeat protein